VTPNDRRILHHRAASCAVLLAILVVAAAHAMGRNSGDSLNVTLAGGAGGQFHEPSGPKGFVSALLYVSLRHPFGKGFSTRISVRAMEATAVPFLHEGYLEWCGKAFAAQAGFLSDRFGAARYHRPRDFLAPLFDRWLLWDTYDWGVRVSGDIGMVNLAGGAGMNNRESGALYATGAIQRQYWDCRVLGGLQTYDTWSQDNVVTAGAEGGLGNAKVGAHGMAAYRRFLGYGSSTNATMQSGWGVDIYGEGFVAPVEQFRASVLARYERSMRRVLRETVTGGAEIEWLPWECLGAGAGLEAMRDQGLDTWAPSLFIDLRPAPEQGELRVRAEPRWTGSSSPTWTISGSLWVQF